jgi:hypothetical protein
MQDPTPFVSGKIAESIKLNKLPAGGLNTVNRAINRSSCAPNKSVHFWRVEDKFAVEATGWGGFYIQITIQYKDRSIVKTNYHLDLSKGWP